MLNSLLNRKAFSYDLNADALYQQYKNQYQALGKLAMEDSMGQASALTGGYGNSYAVSAGSQAYQDYLDKANSMIPEFYGMALNTYNAESDRLANNFGVISADRNTAYGEYADKYNRLAADRDYYANEYNNAYNRDYAQWVDNRNYDQNQYWNEYNAGYQKDRDAVADSQWQQQFAYQKDRDSVADEQFNRQMSLQENEFAYEKANPDYAVTDYASVPKQMRNNIDNIMKAGYDYNKEKLPFQEWGRRNAVTINKKVGAYLDSLVAEGKISPRVAKLLMADYYIEE